MAVNEGQDPEAIWVELLSRQPARIRSAAHALPADEREAVVAHLRRMASDEGWPEAQRASASAALEALGDEGGK